MSADWVLKAINHEWMQANSDGKGGIRDNAVCPVCHKAREGSAYLFKKHNVYVSVCRNCRRTNSGW
jgi:transcription elongation factor Elf1